MNDRSSSSSRWSLRAIVPVQLETARRPSKTAHLTPRRASSLRRMSGSGASDRKPAGARPRSRVAVDGTDERDRGHRAGGDGRSVDRAVDGGAVGAVLQPSHLDADGADETLGVRWTQHRAAKR